MSIAADETADREDEMRTKRICRMCLTTEEPLSDLYSNENRLKSRVPLPLQIMSSVSLEIFTNDGMPRTICDPCRLIIDYCYRFKQICRKSDTLLKQFPLTGCWPERTPLPVYPAELQKVVRAPASAAPIKRKMSISVAAAATNEQVGVKRPRLVGANPVLLNAQKPITPGKATGPKSVKTLISPNGSISTVEASTPPVLHNQRTAANIKSDGKPRILNNASKNGATRQSKPPASPTLQATDDGNLQLLFDSVEYEENAGVTIELSAATNADADDDDDVEDTAAGKPEELDAISTGQCYPCGQCNRTFALRQLLDMHMERHNRDRVAECDICHKRFFTKYDLTKHALVHRIGEKRFMCAVCPAGFSRANLLVRHELQHQDVLRFKCGTCQKKFVSREELEQHERRHKIVRNFQCQHCEKSFAFKQGLDRHEAVHSKHQPFPCSYCGIGFPTATRLARHLTEHAGTRPYPCRICSKSFLLSHHLTRHMRSHQKRARLQKQGGPADNSAELDGSGQSAEYAGDGAEAIDTDTMLECMVCDLAFAGYSELMDHSEQHALESGECPFCKMELLTEALAIEHMRQHGEQQHACEFCDLMFAQEEHKEQHCQLEHIDEQEMYAIDDRARAAKNNVTDSDEDDMVIQVFQSAEGEVRQDGEAILHEFVIPSDAEAEAKDEEPEQEPALQQPRRTTRLAVGAGRASGSPKILNYAKKDVLVKQEKTQQHQTNQLVDDDSANIEDMDFEYMDIVKEEKPSKQSIAAVKQRMRAKTVADAATAAADAAATAQAMASSSSAAASSTPKTSPTKKIPVAQQQFEQQLKNAMRRPDGPATTPTEKTTPTTTPKSGANTTKLAGVKPTTSKTSPVLTKVNVKTLPSGVTLKKVQLNRPSGNTAAPKPVNAAAIQPDARSTPVAGTAAKPVLRRIEVPPRKSIIMRHTPAKTATPARPTAAAPAAATASTSSTGKSTQRIRMTQAQVDEMARDGKIQIKDGQVFVRNQ